MPDPTNLLTYSNWGRCVPLVDYKGNLVHQTRMSFFVRFLMSEGNCSRFQNSCEQITNIAVAFDCAWLRGPCANRAGSHLQSLGLLTQHIFDLV
jgi:hypothetical protein